MGYVAEPDPAMGEYSVEVRRESFYLRGSGERHAIYIYESPIRHGTGTAELLIEDIPKIRAALDQVERHLAGGPDILPTPAAPPAAAGCGAQGQDHSRGCPASDTYPLDGGPL